jgi:hypothetical protein
MPGSAHTVKLYGIKQLDEDEASGGLKTPPSLYQIYYL